MIHIQSGPFQVFIFIIFILFYQKLQKSLMIELQPIVIYNGPYVQIVSQLCSCSGFSETSLTQTKTHNPLLQLTVIYIFDTLRCPAYLRIFDP